MIRRALPTVVFALSLAGLFLLCGWAAFVAGLPSSALERKVAQADRVIYYRMEGSDGPRFRLDGEQTTVSLLSHVVLPLGRGREEPREAVYGLRLALHDPGADSDWVRVIYLRSRRSRAFPFGDTWLRENAFIADSDKVLSDGRRVLIDLPPHSPGSTLTVTMADEATEGFVRGYEVSEATAIQRWLHLLRLYPEEGDALASHVTPIPWGLMGVDERLALLARHAQRLPAAGALDASATEVIYYDGYREPPRRETEESRLRLTRHAPVVVNLRGPTELIVVATDTSEDPGSEKRSVVALSVVSDGAPVPPARWAIPAGGGELRQRVRLPAGVHSVGLRLVEGISADLALVLPAGPSATFGETVAHRAPEGWRLRPARRRLSAYRSARGEDPLVFPVPAAPPGVTRVLRLDIRLLAPDGVLPEDAELRVWTVDRDGHELEHDRVAVHPRSPLWDYTTEPQGATVAVSEAVSFRVFLSEEARSLLVEAARPALVRPSVYLPDGAGEAGLLPPYDELQTPTLRWDHAPVRRRQWFSILARNHDALQLRGGLATAVAAIRLARVQERPTPRVARAATTLLPWGPTERAAIIEAVPRDRLTRTLEIWPPGTYTRLRVGGENQVRFGSGRHDRPRVLYWLEEGAGAALGRNLDLRLDGEAFHSIPIHTMRGLVRVPHAEPGTHAVAIEGPARGVHVAIDRPPGDGWAAPGDLYRMRTVHALRGRPLNLTVHVPQGGTVVNLVAYCTDPAASEGAILETTLDGGQPQRWTGRAVPHVTPAVRQLELPPSEAPSPALFADREGELAGWARTVFIPIGADIAPGAHRLRIRRLAGDPMWVRLFVLSGSASTRHRALGWERLDPAEDVPSGEDPPKEQGESP